MSETFSAVEGMFEANWPGFSKYPTGLGLSIRFKNRSFARIDPWKGGVTMQSSSAAPKHCAWTSSGSP